MLVCAASASCVLAYFRIVAPSSPKHERIFLQSSLHFFFTFIYLSGGYVHVEVRGRLEGIGSLLLCGFFPLLCGLWGSNVSPRAWQ